MERPSAAVVTVSDGVSHGTRQDESGDLAEAMLADAGFDVRRRVVVPDDRPDIESTLESLARDHGLIVTTGGTGFGPRDVTPEATRAVIDREAPGLAELMRAAGLASTPMAALITRWNCSPARRGRILPVTGPRARRETSRSVGLAPASRRPP
jgi:molybdopterin adenylyltransferase